MIKSKLIYTMITMLTLHILPKFFLSLTCLLYFFLISNTLASPYLVDTLKPTPAADDVPQLVQTHEEQTSTVIEAHFSQRKHHIIITLKIPKHFYVYQKSLRLQLTNTPNGILKPLTARHLPKPQMHRDPIYGSTAVYFKHLELTIPFFGQTSKNSKLIFYYQGCNGVLCLPIQRATYTFQMNGLSYHHHPWMLIETFILLFGLGLLLSFTPCVLPMLPILTAILVGKKNISKLRALALASSYILGMSLTYVLLGILISLLGASVSVWLQSKFFIIGASIIFVILAISMLGAFSLQLPSRITNTLSQLQDRQTSGSLKSAFIIGMIASLILSPCTSPPLIGVLTHIAMTGNYIYGGFSLWFLALGMGLPLLLISLGLKTFIPKTGQWMEEVKIFFAFLLLGMALYLLMRIVPFMWIELGSALLLILYALHWMRIQLPLSLRCLAIVPALCAAFLTWNALHTYFYTAHTNTSTSKNIYMSYKTLPQLQSAIKSALTHNHFVILDFYAQWCELCQENDTFIQTPLFRQWLIEKHITLLKADVSIYDSETTQLLNTYHILGMPTLLLLNKEGHEIQRITGKLNNIDTFKLSPL